MKLTSYFFLVFALIGIPSCAMDNTTPASQPKKGIMDQLGILERLIPGTFATAEKSTDAFARIAQDGLVVKHELDDFTHDLGTNGIKVVMDQDSIKQIKKASNSMVKTWITAGAGGALMLGGLILLLYTLISKPHDNDDAEKAWYSKIISNRYLISTLLMASGLILVLKSDKLVSAGAKI